MSELPAWTKAPGRVAIVHDWLTGMRGGEAILDAICEIFPEADLYTLLWTDPVMSPKILNGRKIHTSYLQYLMWIPGLRRGYRKLLPLFPHAISTLDLSQYDLVISNSHCVAKGVSRLKPGGVHVSYISTPMRYVWDMFDEYFGPGRAGFLTRILARLVRKPLQKWDQRSNAHVNVFMANSRFVQKRIQDFWGRESVVVHPFVDLSRFLQYSPNPQDYYLIVSALAPYKRIDLAIEAFKALGLKLKILGKGQDEEKLRAMAAPNIEFLGGLDNRAVTELYLGAKALIFPGIEDFGITPLEAMAAGRPVIALGRGGLLDTVTDKTGILYSDYSVEGLVTAVRQFEAEALQFGEVDCRARAKEFSRAVFVEKFKKVLCQALEKHA